MKKLAIVLAAFFALFAFTAAFAETMPTRRSPENGTKVNLFFGETKIPAVLNDSVTARELITRLPWSVQVTRYEVDFCGTIGEEDFTLHENEVVRGWKNGDISYTADGAYFSILFSGEERQGGNMVNVGVVACPLETLESLHGTLTVRIEKAQ